MERVKAAKVEDQARSSPWRRLALPACAGLCVAACLMAIPAHPRRAAASQSANARAQAIVRRMTLAEKITELHGIHDATHYRYVPPIPRLGIPALRTTNGPAGVGPDGAGRQRPATALPAPIALASTWDVRAARAYGRIEGREARDLGNDLFEAPDINIARVPQNGRTFEAYGEDPYLTGQMAAANIEGIQSEGEIANVKHFVANNQETDRFLVNEIIGPRALHEIYLPAFQAALVQGHAASVMCAYPKINGVYNCENPSLLDGVLEKDWHFDGFVLSDWGATHSTVGSALAGLDLEMPTGIYFGDAMQKAVAAGRVPMAVIDQMLVRRFRTMIRFGLFDRPPRPRPIPSKQDGLIARRLAEEGMVLLKNQDRLLPLDPARLRTLAVIGPYAAHPITGGGGSSHVVPLYTVDPVAGIQALAGPRVRVEFSDGSNPAQTAALARSVDAAIVMVGQMNREGRDHPLDLGEGQDGLVRAVAAANRHTIVVIKSGSAVLMPWADDVPAILEAWYPGEEDGNAVAAILFGDANPSGKLPLTFPRTVSQTFAANPAQYPGVDMVARYSEGIFVGYRYDDANGLAPLFPFGYGLSYTRFAYRDLRISPGRVPAAAPSLEVHVECTVRNVGRRAGAEVVELYVGMPSSAAVPEPPEQLKAFARVALQPGQAAPVRMTLHARSFSYWDVARKRWEVQPGAYRILVGSSSRDIRLRGTFRVRR